MIMHSGITKQVVQYFKDNINGGVWAVGEKIPSENRLTETLGVSRTSVRAAIQYLIALGVLESRHGKGTYLLEDHVDERTGSQTRITAQDCQNVANVLEFRRIVESEACYLAAKRATPALAEALQQALDEMRANKENSAAFVSADIKFHAEICRASGNPLLEKSLLKMFEENRKDHDLMNAIFGYEDGIYYHNLILKEIKEKNAEKARKIMFDHLQNAIDRLACQNVEPPQEGEGAKEDA